MVFENEESFIPQLLRDDETVHCAAKGGAGAGGCGGNCCCCCCCCAICCAHACCPTSWKRPLRLVFVNGKSFIPELLRNEETTCGECCCCCCCCCCDDFPENPELLRFSLDLKSSFEVQLVLV